MPIASFRSARGGEPGSSPWRRQTKCEVKTALTKNFFFFHIRMKESVNRESVQTKTEVTLNQRNERPQSHRWVRYTFIQIAKKNSLQKHFHPKTLSSKNTFIQKHFRPKPFHPKEEDNFIHDTFILKRVHPMTLSSKNGFVQ